ncbi:MAG: dTMP kinase [Acidimicrobiales bacterium]
MARRGRLIALEGVDGSGKSTQARLLAAHLGAVLTHEPGATALGKAVRALVLDPAATLSVTTEALLMAADRAQHVAEVIAPALDAGNWVVTDRYSASTLAYQGYGRAMDLGELRRLVGWATGGLDPDLTVLIDVPVDAATARRAGNDRFEEAGGEFHQRVRQGYLELAAAGGRSWVVVDGTGEVDTLADEIRGVVAERLGVRSGS